MSVGKKIETEFGLEMPVDEAVKKIGEHRKSELEDGDTPVDDAAPMVLEDEFTLVAFKGVPVRKVFHNGEWWFSVIDAVGAVSGSGRARKYWSDLKRQLIETEGLSELSDSIGQLPMPGADGKLYPTDVVNTETLLRIIQSVPSKNAEPFKRWLAKVGYERIQEIHDPEIAIKRAILAYQIQGRSDDWIEKRIRGIVVRNDLTSEWKKRGVEGQEYAFLTNVISAYTFDGVQVNTHKEIKGLKKHHNLRDHMTDLELIFTMLGEKSTTEIAVAKDAQGYDENLGAAKSGGSVAGNARRQLERETGQRVLSRSNFLGKDSRERDPEALSRPKGE
jgi:hypothetical protein